MATIVQVESGQWKAVVRRARFGVRLKVKTFRLKTDAEAWARKTEAEIESGAWRGTSEADKTTLKEALERYARDVVPRMRSNKKEASVIAVLLDTTIARHLLTRVTSKDIASLRDRWLRAVKPSTVRRRFHTLSHVFTVARKEWGMVGLDNPVGEVELPREGKSRDRRVSEAELTAIRKAATSQAMRDYVTLAVETAMRRGELFAANWEDVNIKGRTLLVPVAKSGEPRVVPLSTAAAKTLKRMRGKKTEGRLFERWKTNEAVTLAFVRTVKRARKEYVADCVKRHRTPTSNFLGGVRFHDLRHEAIRRLAHVPGIEVHMLARITGHKTLSMLMRYYNPTPTELAKLLP